MHRLEWYLDRILHGKPVSRSALLTQMEREGHSSGHALRTFKFGPKDLGLVEIKNNAHFSQLRLLYPSLSKPGSRSEAAIGGRSHDVAVDSAILLVSSIQHPHPMVVVNGVGGSSAPRPLNTQALIVENLQNFLELESTLHFAATHAGLDPETVEVIWSDGNAINNRLNTQFLTAFESTWWLVDCDPGGLQILANAIRSLPGEGLHIVTPTDLDQRLIKHGAVLSAKEREVVFKLAQSCPPLSHLAEQMMRSHRKLEQETYLIDQEDTGQ